MQAQQPQSKPKASQNWGNIVAYICLVLIYTLIVIYAIFSQSIESTLAVLFMIISVIFNIASPLHLALKHHTDKPYDWTKVTPYQVDRIVWAIFIVLNVGFFLLKVVLYYTSATDEWSPELQAFMEVQSLQYIFVPIILIPVAAGTLFLKPKSKMLKQYSKKINPFTVLPLYLSLTALVLLVQIFSTSIAGLLYFALAIYIYFMKSFNFKDTQFKILLIAVQVLSGIMITLNYLTTCDYLQTSSGLEFFAFFGINSIIDFTDSAFSRGHIICEVLLGLLTAYLNRLFIYESFNALCKADSSSLFDDPLRLMKKGSKEQTERKADGVGVFVPYSRAQSQLDRMRKVSSLPNQVELRNMALSVHSDQPLAQSISDVHRAQDQRILMDLLPYEQEVVDEDKDSGKKLSKMEQSARQWQKIKKSILNVIHVVFNFLNSPQFSLRVIELLSIIVIQRNNNIYSLVSLFWLVIVCTIQNQKVVLICTGFVMLPLEFFNFIAIYFFNIPYSPAQNVQNGGIFGFTPAAQLWLDVIIFNLFFNYIFLYLKSYDQVKHINYRNTKKFTGKPKTWELIVAYFFRYSYMMTLIAMFFLGFSKQTLMNIILVTLFLIFFSKGDNLILKKKTTAGGVQKLTLTTFCKRYWLVIVYYTLACILAKYLYFLFWDGDLSQQLQPSGINQTYNWSFNFSLTSTCHSNTTPWFIIFVLAQIQIIIYRSSIYNNLSFSIMGYINQDAPLHPITVTQKRKRKLIDFIIAANEIYYQILYYVSGFIIIGCSYGWSFLGLAIIILTILGLLIHFSNKIVVAILFLNLSFIFLNYLALLINEYTFLVEILTPDFVILLNKIALAIGLSLNSNYYSVFILNVVIFYFAVLCYSLATILKTPLRQSISIAAEPPLSPLPKDSLLKESLRGNFQQYKSMFDKSVLESEFDMNFADNYKRGVIGQIQTYYKQDLVRKYTWVRSIGDFFLLFWTDIVTIFVILECLFFRVSISMLCFLAVYLVFYFTLFDRLGSLFQVSGYYELITQQMKKFAAKQNLLENKEDPASMVQDREQVLRSESQMRLIVQNTRLLKNSFKKMIWKYSAILSATCLVLTYASQFLISDFYNENIYLSITEDIEIVLFVLGINVNPGSGLAAYIYFYYIMLIINVIEKLILIYIERINVMQAEERSQSQHSVEDLNQLENPTWLIHDFKGEEFIDQMEIVEQLQPAREASQSLLMTILGDLGRQYYQQANILIYFGYRHSSFKIECMLGLLTFIIRFYLWLMLINVYAKSNVFAFGYLAAVVYFWFQSVSFDLIRTINKAAIALLTLQYVMLLLDINSVISPLPLPYNLNLSLLELLIKNNPSLVNFLAVSSQDQVQNDSFLVSFIVNSIIIFLTELCFTIYATISETMMQIILGVYLRYENILQRLSAVSDNNPVIVNYNNYKHLSFRVLSFLYQAVITRSYLFVALLIFILLGSVSGYLAVLLLIIAFLYIYFGIFAKSSNDPAVIGYTRLYFRSFNILQFICLLITTVLQIPVISDNESISRIIKQVGALTSIEQLVLMLFIQLWLDLQATEDFQGLSDLYRDHSREREAVYLRTLAFQRNNFLIGSLARQYKELVTFDMSIAEATSIIKNWHNLTHKEFKTVDYDFQMVNYNPRIKAQIQEERLADDRKQFSVLLQTYLRQYTDMPLLYNYIQVTRYLTNNIYTIVFQGDLHLSCWSFIKEDYSAIKKYIDEYDIRMQKIVEEIGEADEDQTMGLTLLALKEGLTQEDQPPSKVILDTPSKLVIDIDPKKEETSLTRYIVPFLLSNIETLIILLIAIYYCLNPCLLSIPLIAFAFLYFAIATRKHVYLMVIYIFLIILASELLYIFVPNYNSETDKAIKLLFPTDPDKNIVYYNLPYVYFVFVVVFLSQEIIRYKGNRYTSEIEVQNIEQALLRVLMNEPQTSKLDIWKYAQEQQVAIEQYNPFSIATFQIDNRLQKLVINDSLFDDVFSDRKIGVDLYPATAAVQILLMIYIIFFYPLMTDVNGYSLEDTTKYYQFSSDMVIGVLVHVVAMIIERYIAIAGLPRHKKLIIKYIWTIIIFILFCWFIYYLAPFKQLYTSLANLYAPSRALIAFSFFYFFYFYLSALQIKYGYQQAKSLNSLMTRRGFANYYAVTVYTAIPFLYELKIIIDWTFTSTSLTLFDWFRQFSIYLRAFKSKIQYYNATGNNYIKPQPWTSKIIGWVGFILIVIIIFGPMVLFSGLNPISQPNLVVSGSLQVSLQVVGGNSFPLYTTSHFSLPPQNFTQQQFNQQGFVNVPILQQMTASDIPVQFQSITYETYSDSNWGIALPNYNQLIEMLNTSITQLQANQTPTYKFQILTTYKLQRQVTEIVSSSTQFVYPLNGSVLDLVLLEQFYDTLTICSASVSIPGFYISLIRLNTIDNTYKPRPIVFTNASGQPYLYNANLNLFCPSGQTTVDDLNDVYWGLYLQNDQSGIELYVYCDKYQNIIGGYGFTALYTSIILVIAGFVRSMFDGNMPLIPYEMNPRPDNLLSICQAISTLRLRKQYRQEYLMYYQLIDLIRSPQIMKYMSGSYPYLIEKARIESERQGKLKGLQKNKNI